MILPAAGVDAVTSHRQGVQWQRSDHGCAWDATQDGPMRRKDSHDGQGGTAEQGGGRGQGTGGGETGGEWWDGRSVPAACLPVPLWAPVLRWTEKLPQESFNSVQPLQLQPHLQESVPVSTCLSACVCTCLYLSDWLTVCVLYLWFLLWTAHGWICRRLID